MNINREDWKQIKLGDVAIEYSKRINDPSKSEFDRFVGSSNIEQWDFRINNWENTSSVTSAMKLFKKGDYLLVRRSLYASDFRERAPRASFSGVCSGDILSIKENPIWRSFEVIAIPKSRVSAKLVKDYCTETTPDAELKILEEQKLINQQQKHFGWHGRPTKKNRRDIDKMKG